MATFTIEGEEIITKTVGDGGFSGRIYVPKSWQGETVKVVRLSGSNNEKEKEEKKEEEKGEERVQGKPGETEGRGERGVNIA